jgi:hypothetical protein
MSVTKLNALLQCKFFQKNEFLRNFGPLIEHGPHWINFTILTFISEKNDIPDAYIKFGTKLFHLTGEKKGEV